MFPTPTRISKPAATGIIALMALVAGVGGLGGCSSGPRERTMTARNSIVMGATGSSDIAYFAVHEDQPRTSVQAPVAATASSEWLPHR